MMPLVRSFVCLELPSPVRQVLGDEVALLRKGNSSFRWVRAERMHITLAFCGEHPREAVERFAAALGREIVRGNFGPLPLRLSGLGGFPRDGSARVLFAAVEERTGELSRLAGRVGAVALEVGLLRETPRFRPHITLGRAETPARIPGGSALDGKGVRWTADTVTYMKSELRPSGPDYTVMERWSLRGEGADGGGAPNGRE